MSKDKVVYAHLPVTPEEEEAMEQRMEVIGQNGNTGEHYREERDPLGIAPHDPGAKLDAGKPRVGLVLGGFPKALRAVSRLGTSGADKYSPDGWKHVPGGIPRYTDAMLRHYLDEADGERRDGQTGELHATAVAWNALARLELILEELDKRAT